MEVGSVAGDWKCDRVLGKGNFGVVTLWTNQSNGQSRAIKHFEVSDTLDDSTVRQVECRWRNEVDMMSHKVESPFIVSTQPTPNELKTSGRLLLAMEFCAGRDLRKILRDPQLACGLPEQEVIKVLSAIGGAIQYLHSINIIHRDLKPENILRTTSSNDGVYKLGDLGFAKGLLQNDSLSSTVIGTIQYLAPEVFFCKPYDITVDYWSFGMIAFEIITGMRPFLHGQPTTEWLPEVEKKADDIIAIHENADGQRIYSNHFPYNTHLSERLKQCLEMWLKMMLQLDPKKRGRRLTANSKTGGELIGLGVLRTILQMEMLHIFCPSKRLSFAIGNSTTMADVAGWIERDIGVKQDDQLLLTSEGQILSTTYKPLTAVRQNLELEWFMIPKSFESTLTSSPVPKCLKDFNISSSSNLSTRAWLDRPLWAVVIYQTRKTLQELKMMGKAVSALSLHNQTVAYSNLSDELKVLEMELKHLEGILAMEKALEEVEDEFQENLDADIRSHNESKTDWTETLNAIRVELKKESASLSVESSTTHAQLDEGSSRLWIKVEERLEELNNQILDCFDVWRLNCLESFYCSIKSTRVGLLVDRFFVLHHQHVPLMTRCLSNALERYVKLSEISHSFASCTERMVDWKHELLEVRKMKLRQLLDRRCLSASTLSSHSLSNTVSRARSRDDEMKKLMNESVTMDEEVEKILKRSMESLEEVRGSRQKLYSSFLDSSEK